MIVQHCQAQGRRKCGRTARVWARVSVKQWGGHVSVKTIAFCDRCLAASPMDPKVVGPVESTKIEEIAI